MKGSRAGACIPHKHRCIDIKRWRQNCVSAFSLYVEGPSLLLCYKHHSPAKCVPRQPLPLPLHTHRCMNTAARALVTVVTVHLSSRSKSVTEPHIRVRAKCISAYMSEVQRMTTHNMHKPNPLQTEKKSNSSFDFTKMAFWMHMNYVTKGH